jgi:hypothetical protein
MSELEMDLCDLENLDENEDYIEYGDLKARWLLKRNELVDKYKVGKSCPRCGLSLIPSVISDYDYQCLYCDEDFYDCEVE